MDNVEQLREALFELNQQRNSDLEQLEQSQAVLAGLENITAAPSPADALGALLSSVRTSTGCDAAVLLECVGSNCIAIASTEPELGDCTTVDADFISKRSKRVVDLNAVSKAANALTCDGRYRSMISAPFEVTQGEILILVCLSCAHAGLTQQHQNIAQRLIALAAQTFASKKLADENALLAEVLNRSSASFSIADADDPECPLVYVNEAFEKLTGYTEADVLGRNCRFLSAEDPNGPIRQRIRQTIANRGVGEFELRNRRKSGDLFWNNLGLFPVEAGDKAYMVATQWDLTSRVEAEQERDTARQQLVSALEQVREGILLLDAEDFIVFANSQFQMFHSLPNGALTQGATFVDAWSDALEQKGRSPQDARSIAQDVLSELKKPCVQKDRALGSGFQVLVTNALTSVGGTVSVFSDVTALKVAQKQLSERVAAIDSMQDGMAITDMAGRIIYLNPSHARMFGHQNPNRLIGQRWSLLYQTEQRTFIEEVAIPSMSRSGQWRGDVIGRRRDTEPVAHEVTLTKLDGSGLICVTRDISERLSGEAERDALKDRVNTAQRQEAIGQMAAGLAHDFNNCLSVMSGSAALVQQSRSEEERAQHAQRIIDAGEKAAELTKSLLSFGARNSQRSALDIRDAMRSALDLVRSSIPSNIDLAVSLPASPVTCDIDPTDVLQVILNLVINARDAIGTSAGRIAITLQEVSGQVLGQDHLIGDIDDQGDYAVVTVEDNGPGIAVDDLGSLFDAYVTTKADQGGTGLGLSVVRSLVQANDGGIDVTSTLSVGTKFTVCLPLEGTHIRSKHEDVAEHVHFDKIAAKVVVVDDDLPVAETIATSLEKMGCEVVICDAPAEAIEVVQADASYWDIMITDYDMPDMNGADLAEKIRIIAPDLPIILCTALPSIMGGVRAGSKLFDARISKPIDLKRLVSEIAKATKA